MQCSGRENGNLMVTLIFFCYHSMHLFIKTNWNCKATGIKISGEEEDNNVFRHFVAAAAAASLKLISDGRRVENCGGESRVVIEGPFLRRPQKQI